MAETPNKPITRKETYLAAIAGQNVDLPPYPITREEAYLDEIAKNGSGGGGTSNYNQLTNKPQINSVELSGNKTSAQLGLMASDGVVANPTGQTTGTLTALEVGGTKYAVPSGGTSDYTNLTNKPSINGVELSGNKTASQLGMANSNTFQGTIAEWNQLTTAEKKAYDHASIPDSIDGGVTFPANKVIMTGGGNVEDKINGIFTIHEVSKTITTNGNGILPISSEFNLDLDKCIVTSIHIDGQYKFELYNTFNNNDRKLNIAVIGAATDAYFRIKNTDVPVLIRYIEWD